jgi:hypothetical protein
MPSLLTRRRIVALLVLLAVAAFAGWILWNHSSEADMAAYVPADCLAFVESNDLERVATHISSTNAWRALAVPIGSRENLLPHPWLARFARWTGMGSTESVIFARSQVAFVLTNAQTNQTGNVLTVKPVAALILETHTTQKRVRPVLEKLIEDFANRVVGPTVRQNKQDNGIDVIEWSSRDGNRHVLMTFAGTTVIVSNDELLLLRCVNVRRGVAPSLASNQQLITTRTEVGAAQSSIFGFVSHSGIKPLLQAWLLSQPRVSEDSLTIARLFGDTFGNLIDSFACSVKLADDATEDHCFASFAPGVADQIRANISPGSKTNDKLLAFVPVDAYSVSVYRVNDTDGFWQALNTTISSHADALAAIASRPFLRSLVRAYGVEDADSFARAIGPNFATIRVDNISRSVLVAETFDRQILRQLAQKRLATAARTEVIGDAELILSSTDDWAIAFVDNYFVSGPAESIRQCLQVKSYSQSITNIDRFKRAQQLIDVSLPINLAKFTDDRQPAISFIELFSQSQRPTFSASGESVDKASRTLPYAVSVAMLKEDGFDLTSRSSFGLMGSLLVYLVPGQAH